MTAAQPEGVDTRRALANAVASECARGGWRVESQTEVNAILAKGKAHKPRYPYLPLDHHSRALGTCVGSVVVLEPRAAVSPPSR
jgi:hypothetical protein